MGFLVEGADHADAGKVFEQHGADAVKQFLQFAEQRRRGSHDEQRHDAHEGYRHQQPQRQGHVKPERQGQRDDEYDRHRHQHAQHIGHGHLDVDHVVDRSRGYRCRTEIAEIIDRQIHGFAVQSHAHVLADARGQLRAAPSARHGAHAGNQRGHAHADRRDGHLLE